MVLACLSLLMLALLTDGPRDHCTCQRGTLVVVSDAFALYSFIHSRLQLGTACVVHLRLRAESIA